MSEELQQLVPIEEQISQELVKQNVTESIIAGLKEKYLPLKISGIEDKETYLLVKDARKECKALRVLAKKICEKGREDAVAIQKAWVGKQKEVTDQIAEVEDYLEKQEKEFEAAVAKDKEDRKRRNEEQLIVRHQLLSSMGVTYSDGYFTLEEVSFELSLVKESEPDIWEESILPKFKAEYEVVQRVAIIEAEAKKRADEEFKKQQEDLERGKKELAEKEAALKKALDDQAEEQRKDVLLKEAQERERIEKLWRGRLERLRPIGWNGQEAFAKYDENVIVATYQQLIEMSDETFANVLNIYQQNVENDARLKEQKRLAEIEEQKEIERVMALGKSRLEQLKRYDAETTGKIDVMGKWSDEEWEIIRAGWQDVYDKEQKEKWEKEQEEKRQLDELRKQQELALSGDKVKWAEIIKQLDEITLYTMISVQYKKKLGIMREKLEEIKAL